jgi:multidrug efflux pump subunit AcrA (membrane-fusion protein)
MLGPRGNPTWRRPPPGRGLQAPSGHATGLRAGLRWRTVPFASFTALALVCAFGPCGCERSEAKPPPRPPPTVSVAAPVVREVVEWDEYTGRLGAVESVGVRARVSGYLESIHFKDGQIVTRTSFCS